MLFYFLLAYFALLLALDGRIGKGMFTALVLVLVRVEIPLFVDVVVGELHGWDWDGMGYKTGWLGWMDGMG